MRTYVDPSALTSTARAAGVVRRLRALAWMGHDPAVVAVEYDLDVLLVRELCNAGTQSDLGRRFERVEFPVDVWWGVATAYDDLSMTFGPSEHYRRKAAREVWMPPLAWDDEALDDPVRRSNKGGKPGPNDPPRAHYLRDYDHAVVRRRLNGDHTVHMWPADITECVRILYGRGMSDNAIADALGLWVKQVARARKGLGLEPHNNIDRGVVAGGYSRAKGLATGGHVRRSKAERRARAEALENSAA